MKDRIIRTGIIGGSLNNQWASKTHIPALRQSARHQITAIATSRMESALQSAAEVGAPLAFTGHKELCECPEVDLVVVSIKVPFHYEAVKAAIAAGKHVYCEWPLAVTAKQAEELAMLADRAGIHHAIGLQARQSAALQDVKQRIARGEIGRILSCTMQVSTQGKGKYTDRNGAYLLKEENGATLLSINGGHALDVLCFLLGDFKELSAMMNCRDAEAIVLETGEKVAFRIKQHASVGHVQFGNLQVEQASYPAVYTIAASDDHHFQTTCERTEGPESPMLQVWKAHELLADDILNGTRMSPNFHDAVRLHRLLETIRYAADTGTRQIIGGNATPLSGH